MGFVMRIDNFQNKIHNSVGKSQSIIFSPVNSARRSGEYRSSHAENHHDQHNFSKLFHFYTLSFWLFFNRTC